MFTMSFIQFTSDSNGECDAGKQGDVQKYLGHYLYPCSAEQVTVIHKKVVCVFNFLFRLIGSPGGGFYLFAFDNTNM